jgi:hypothetical protein
MTPIPRFSAIAVLTFACSSAPSASVPVPAGQTTTVPADAPGWRHTLARSKFHLGRALTDDVSRPPVVRHVGDEGVFWENTASGASGGISNADSRALAGPYVTDRDLLRATVLQYFRDSGMPEDQLDPSGIGLSTTGSNSSDGSQTLVKQTGVAGRLVDGAFPVSSIAFTDFTVDGETTSESVFWPAIPGRVIADARAMRDMLADPSARAAFLAKIEMILPGAGAARGVVDILHSGPFAEGPITAFAAYDVGVGSAFRHFDIDGQPLPDPPH